MLPVHRRLAFDPVSLVALALLGAAIMVVYLQRRALVELNEQSTVILEQVLEQTANDIARDIRAAIQAPVYDTLEVFTRADLQANGLDGVLRTYADAVEKHPHIDRFFVWSRQTEAIAAEEVLFFSRAANEKHHADPAAGIEPVVDSDVTRGLWRDPELGRRIYQDMHASGQAQKRSSMALKYRQSSMGLTYRRDDCTYDILGSSWLEHERDRFFFIVGVAVCLERAGERLLSALYKDHIAGWLRRSDAGAPLQLHVFDHERRVIFGSAPLNQGIARSVTLPALSYPYPSPLPSTVTSEPQAPREWTVRVSSRSPGAATVRTQSYWILGMSVLLMVVALMITVRSQKRAWELAAMQAEFVAHVSHQLRTPISLLTTVTETLALDRMKSPEKLPQYIDIMRTETNRLSTLVERILEFSVVDGGRTYHYESVDLVPLVSETVGAFSKKPSTEGFTFRIDAVGASPIVEADPAALEQVLLNLLDNAVKYSGQAREVTVRVSHTPSDAVIEVTDRGVGIPPAEQPRIFDRFYRGTGAGQQRGFGIGLTVVREIIDAHRGRIEVHSAVGCGSTFRIRLPLLTTSEPAE